MYHLIKSEKFTLYHLVFGLMSFYRHTEIRHFRNFWTALKACEIANHRGRPNHYIVNDSDQEYYHGTWID